MWQGKIDMTEKANNKTHAGSEESGFPIAMLESFLRGALTKAQLQKQFGKDLYNVENKCSVRVTRKDVLHVIDLYRSGTWDKERLVEWVNVVWFTDLFAYKTADEECIASILEILETLDEEGVQITEAEWQTMQKCLQINRPYQE